MANSEFQLPLPQVIRTKHLVTGSQDVYRMRSKPRGTCLIVNNVNFKHLTQRKGSEHDARRLRHVFHELGFEVTVVHDQTTQDLRKALQAVAKDKERNASSDALVVAVMSHGDRNTICGTEHDPDDQRANKMTYEDLVEPFSNIMCPQLRNKPKLFFIQACQGGNLSEGVEEDSIQTFRPREDRLLPPTSDCLLSFASQEGFATIRDSSLGSVYVSHLVQVLAEFSHRCEILEMLTVVEKRVRESQLSWLKKVSEEKHVLVQLCLSTSVKLVGWSKKLYFNPEDKDAVEVELLTLYQRLGPGQEETMETRDEGVEEQPPPKPARKSTRTSEEDRQLWVMGGSCDPEVLPQVGADWIAKCGTGLDRWHVPVANSGGPLVVHCRDELYSWKPKSRRPKFLCKTMVEGASYAWHDNRVYVLGGQVADGRPVASCSVFQQDSATFQSFQPDMDLSLATTGRPATVLKGKIYILSGSRDQLSDFLDVLDPAAKCRTTVGARMSKCKRGQALASCENYVWVFGGHDGARTLADVERYCPERGLWESRRPMPTPRMLLSVTYYDGNFYAIGGESSVCVLGVVEIYDPLEDSWSPGPSLQFPRSGHGSVALP